MVHASGFLSSLAAVLGVAAITTLVCRKLKLPLILGYLVAGVLVGPYTPPLGLADPETVRELSELGVILLLYSIGLELSLRDLVRIGWRGAVIALTGFGITFWLGSMVVAAMGFSGVVAVFLAASLCISSTMLIARTFAERNVSGRLRDTVFGVLVIEDIIAILMLALLTTLVTTQSFDSRDLLRTAGRLLAFLLVLGVVGILVIPRLLRSVAHHDSDETLLVAAVGICFVCALAALSMGYSVALGAFIAGTLSAESGEQKRIEHLIKPLVTLFGAVFFVAAGMAIDPRLIAQYWYLILALLPVVLIGKLIGITLGFFATGHGVRTSAQAGLSMAQTGEFAFIIAALGTTLGPQATVLMPVAAGVAAISMLITPYAIRFAPRIASAVDAGLPRRLQTFVSLYGSWIERMSARSSENVPRTRRLIRKIVVDAVLLVLVAACAGLLGDDAKRWLRLSTELSVLSARTVVYAGFILLALPVGYGMWRSIAALGHELAWRALPRSAPEDVDFAQAPRRVFVLSLQLGLLLVVSLPLLAITQPLLPELPGLLLLVAVLLGSSLAFWRSTGELVAHTRAGATAMLEALGQLKGGREREEPEQDPDQMDALEALLPGLGDFAGLQLPAQCPVVGRSLGALNLRGLTGATVLAIRRGSSSVITPSGEEVLSAGDVLILAGTTESLNSARELLLRA
jgi:CPA2 family monovalent cation:H+ antiporter-2